MSSSPLAPGVGPLAPETWYSITATDTNPDCVNYERTFKVAYFYDNDGIDYSVVCGKCGQLMTITSATVLDPQPVFS